MIRNFELKNIRYGHFFIYLTEDNWRHFEFYDVIYEYVLVLLLFNMSPSSGEEINEDDDDDDSSSLISSPLLGEELLYHLH